MSTNEKEYNGYLFDQLSSVERIENALKRDGFTKETAAETFAQIELEKTQINRKLYQDPTLTNN